MILLRQAGRAALCWAAAHPFRAAQVALAVAVVGATLVRTRRLDGEMLKRLARAFL